MTEISQGSAFGILLCWRLVMQLYTDVSGIFSQANHEFEDVQLLLRHTKTQMISDVLSILSTV